MENSLDILQRLADKIKQHKGADPVHSYVATLFAKGDDAIIKKIGEEATEAVMAAKDGDKIRIKEELADLWFHCLMLLVRHGEAIGRHEDLVLAVPARKEWRAGDGQNAH